MIKTYMPNALMRAATDIIKAHPADSGASSMTEQQRNDLMQRIEKCPDDQIPSLADILLRREVFALCTCLVYAKYRSNISKMVQILSLRMNASLYAELLMQWQAYPSNQTLLRLLAQHDAKENHPFSLSVPTGFFKKRAESPDIFREIANYIVNCSGDQFKDKYQTTGLLPDYPLYIRCYGSYLSICKFSDYFHEGETQIISCVRRLETDFAERIMINLLICGNSDRKSLVKFQKCFELMLSMWKSPASHRFPKHQELALKVYIWWYNYIEMTNSFLLDADPRRKNFWENYLDRCDVVRFKKYRMVVFYFDRFCATEFEDVGQIYIFEREYFKKSVQPRLANQSGSQLKSWLLKDSAFLYNKRHQGRWEPEVAATLRKYI